MKRLLALTMGLLVCAAAPAAAQDDVASFYKGKIVRLVVGIGSALGYMLHRPPGGLAAHSIGYVYVPAALGVAGVSQCGGDAGGGGHVRGV